MANLVFISTTLVFIVILTIFVIAMGLGLFLITRRRRHQEERIVKVAPPALDFTLRLAKNFDLQKQADWLEKRSNTVGRIDRRSVESFYWMPAGTMPRGYENYAHSASTLSKSTNGSVFFV